MSCINNKTGLASPVLHLFLPLTLGEISAYSFRHANNFPLPLSKLSPVHNSFFTTLPSFGTPNHNTSNYLLVLQHSKTASPSFTMARIAIFGTCKGPIYALPHYALCFALVTALWTLIWNPFDSVVAGLQKHSKTFSCSAIWPYTIDIYFF